MPGKKDPRIKKEDTYQALKKEGMSSEKAARIANAQKAGTIDHKSEKLEERSKTDLMSQAKEIGISGRSKMTKSELISAIRNH
ncbi:MULTISPECIES: Rho termination factor N-terminal domain-containing protein [unclassified Sphingobacterium]|uniref:DUF7218 family protein n=1 Tax=unclassified Sphingobacterium TaxID=2609468 RepID=UPI00265CD5CE|nr:MULTISPECIES: Rho termination factor N-terminal domain-containing protein [unclassified Sphingobacterium]WKK56980.1 Rho termination factor N-terminal domain-containing protein [Sphingobacterium sp. BN32]